MSIDQAGTMVFWVIDNGQRVKTNTSVHGDFEITSLSQDINGTLLYTASTDGTIKVTNYCDHCYTTPTVS